MNLRLSIVPLLLAGLQFCKAEEPTYYFFNTWEIYDEESGEVTGETISEFFREASSLTFQLTDVPESGYQVDLTDEETSTTHLALENFTIKSCNAVAGTTIWGVVTDAEQTIIATAQSSATGTGEAISFDFSTEAPILQTSTSYTLYFVAEDETSDISKLAIGTPFNLTPTKLGIAWTTDGWEDENGTWHTSFPEGEELHYNDTGDSKGNAPAISIWAHAVPEPTTATMSLLALTALISRRRRR